MKLIVGLGNPGKQYERTRHNVGFRVVDVLARRWGIEMTTEKFHGWHGVGFAGSEKVVLLKPTTFMNRSGQAVLAAGRFYKLELHDLITASDDLALPLGTIRVRAGGSSGGQLGLQDIIDRLGTDEFSRVRIGIGAATGPAPDYVLSPFSADEEKDVQAVLQRAGDAITCWVEQGTEAAMNAFNR